MFFSDFVFILIVVQGVGGQDVTESIRIMCTNKYSVSHDRERPDDNMHRIDNKLDTSATPETCWGWCNQDVTCRSVTYRITGDGWRYCYKYSISVQLLKDTGRDDEIYTEYNTYYTTFITYDRECATPTTTTTTSPTTTTVLPGAMCIYPVSHDTEAPEWEFYRIDDDFLRDDYATKVTCWNYCNEDEKCRSALHIIHGDGRRYCYRFNITVQELKDSERYIDIYTVTNTNFTPTYTTYDRDCGVCRYPVSHVWKDPILNYRIDWICDDTTTTKTCQDWCNKDVNCRSVTYRVFEHSRYCIKYNISVQELKHTGRENEIYRWRFHKYITYDRDCAAHPSTLCHKTYSVSHEGEFLNYDLYGISWTRDHHATFTPETCWNYCNQDERCRSVLYEFESDGDRYCKKFSISVQPLKDTGRYNEIINKDTGTIITYDKQCVQSIRIMCTYEYPVSHDWQSPDYDLYYIYYIRDYRSTPETCQDWCNQDVTCRSVLYKISGYERRYCYKYNISLQKLKDTGRYNEIYNETDTDWYLTYITYDRDCGECTTNYSVSHDRQRTWSKYFIDYIRDDSATPETCQDYCNQDVTCRSVFVEIYRHGKRYCTKYNISIQILKDTGRDYEIETYTNTDFAPTYITYDRDCGNHTYTVSHNWQSPATHLQIDSMGKYKATAKTCQDYCTLDMWCRSVLYEIIGGDHSCTKFKISVQELKDNGRDNEIYNATVPYITYDRDCVEVSPATKGPGTDVDEVSPATKGPGTNVAAIGEPMIILILMIGAGAVFVAPMIPGAEVAF